MVFVSKSIFISLLFHGLLLGTLACLPLQQLRRFPTGGSQSSIALVASFAAVSAARPAEPDVRLPDSTETPPADDLSKPTTLMQRPRRSSEAVSQDVVRQGPVPAPPPTPVEASKRTRKPPAESKPIIADAKFEPRRRRELEPPPPTPTVVAIATPAAPAQTKAADFSQNRPPGYPTLAIERRWEGLVRLRLHVSTIGKVEQAEVVESSGHAILDQAALSAVLDWQGAPAERFGRPIESVEIIPIRFRL